MALLLTLSSTAGAGQLPVYRVLSEGGTPSYLVGTMHSEDPRVLARLAHLTPLIEKVDTVVIEMVPDAVALLAVAAATLLPVDQNLRGVVGEAGYWALRDAAEERGIPEAVLNRLKPWAAAVTLGMPPAKTGRFLDMEIYLAAQQRGRPVVGLETPAEQLALTTTTTCRRRCCWRCSTTRSRTQQQQPKQLEELTEAYLQGDPDLLYRTARAQYAKMPPALVQWWFAGQVIEQRTRECWNVSHPLLAKKAVLVAVGAMHLGGDTGLVAGWSNLATGWSPGPKCQ
ncbi:MAG: TraB/GumN family protein [Chromatiaceae bacterium]|nr:TraB/GumN family protein [Chromatiaceae bacterium]